MGEIVEIVAMQRFQPGFSLYYPVFGRGVVTSKASGRSGEQATHGGVPLSCLHLNSRRMYIYMIRKKKVSSLLMFFGCFCEFFVVYCILLFAHLCTKHLQSVRSAYRLFMPECAFFAEPCCTCTEQLVDSQTKNLWSILSQTYLCAVASVEAPALSCACCEAHGRFSPRLPGFLR